MSQRPELEQFMSTLYRSGMSIEQVIEHGFDFACNQEFERGASIAYDSITRSMAAKAILEAAQLMGISLDQQRASGGTREQR